MRIFFLLILLMLMSFMAKVNAKVISHHFRIGNTTVVILQENNGPGKTFIHVHQNEVTALKAARQVIRLKGGGIITLVHPGGRNISFTLKGKRYEFDPNRIYTDEGIKKTLTEYGNYDVGAHKLVRKFAGEITKLLPSGKIIAVHNNESYSLKDYLPGNHLEKDVSLINYNKENFYRNFYFLTNMSDFTRLTKMNFNGVLQSTNATDDGSLSIFLADRNFINVEAGYSELTQQIDMLMHA